MQNETCYNKEIIKKIDPFNPEGKTVTVVVRRGDGDYTPFERKVHVDLVERMRMIGI